MKLFDVLFGRHDPLPDLPPSDATDADVAAASDRRLKDLTRRTAEVERRLQAMDIERDTYRARCDDDDPPKGSS